MASASAKNSKGGLVSDWRILLAGCLLAFSGGWFFRSFTNTINAPLPLRLGGYEFISPLLACNFNATNAVPPSPSLTDGLTSVVDDHKKNGDIERASIYIADFATGKYANVNGDEKYYPSSLGKVPIMMAYLAIAENSTTLLDRVVTYPVGQPDLNASQEIRPAQAIIPGESYSIKTLIDYMMKYSDNNAAALLFDLANQESLRNVYSDLQVPFEDQVTSSTADFMTPREYSILFRTLYNSTYLSRDFSEEALRTMTDSSFTQGIVAGVPTSTVVAHKLGILSFVNNGIPTERELHDCGIVYAPGHPYLLCVMTRGASNLSSMEGTIADISKTAYAEVENSSK